MSKEAPAGAPAKDQKHTLEWGIRTAESLWTGYASMGVDFSGTRLLDFGCAWGYFCLLALERGCLSATGVDIEPHWAKLEDRHLLDRSDLSLLAGNLLDLKALTSARFDLIVSSGTLFLLDSEQLDGILAWFYDHLVPGGQALLRTRCLTAKQYNDLGSRLSLAGAQLLFSRRDINELLVKRGNTSLKSHLAYTGATWIMACRGAGFDVVNVRRHANIEVSRTAAAHEAKTQWLDPAEIATGEITLHLQKPVRPVDVSVLRQGGEP